MIIFGWGRRTFHHAGPVLFQRCPHCNNSNWFTLVAVRRWLTLFFIPVIPYERRHMLICPVCHRGVHLAGAELRRAKALNQLAGLYTSNAINGEEYMRRLRETDVVAAAVAAPPAFATTAPAMVADGFGGYHSENPALSSAPPMPSTPPAFQGTGISRTGKAVRIVVPVLAIAVVVVVVTLTAQGFRPSSTQSSFQAGDCIRTSTGSSYLTSVSCSGSHEGRIDQVLSASGTFCPPADTEVAIQPPNPDLCVDFNDHTP